MSAVQEPVVSSTPTGGNVPEEEDEYTVERVLDRKFDTVKGQIMYLIKWQGYSDQDNTWEPEDNLADCPDLLVDFNKRLEEHNELAERDSVAASEVDRPLPMTNAAKAKALTEGQGSIEPIGFARGLEAEKVMGATDCGGELCFLIKWKGSAAADVVPAREANQKCPQVVIKFYEDRIRFCKPRTIEQMLGEEEEPDPVAEAEESGESELDAEDDTIIG